VPSCVPKQSAAPVASSRTTPAPLGFLVALAVSSLVLALVAGCEPQATGPKLPVAPPGAITVLFSDDNQGVLSSCGCASSPSGGLAKRQSVIDDLRRQRPGVLVVDAGDMFGERPNAIKTKYMIKALARSGYDAIGLGDNDFSLGVAALRAMVRDDKLPLICANVTDETGQPVVPPHVIREAAGLRVGIFAVIADAAYGVPPLEWRKGLHVEPPLEAARREVRDLAGCDVIIALSHQPLAATKELARSVPGIQIVVSGHDETVLQEPLAVGDARIVGTGPIGRLLGALTYARGQGSGPVVAQELVGLSIKVPDSKWVLDLYWQYVKEAKGEPPPDWMLTTIPEHYEPSENCGKCHVEEYLQWTGTRHAHAYGTIEKVGRQEDPECILCHTMGYGREGGFTSITKTHDLGKVTCQACHPCTSAHGFVGAKKDPTLDPKTNLTSRQCVACHGLIESPKFNFQTYKTLIAHLPPGVTPAPPPRQ
jgi:hypothetical protein